jgi:hypothetical protein
MPYDEVYVVDSRQRPWRWSLSLILIFMLVMWVVAVGAALLVARARLTADAPTLVDELVARAVAFVAVSAALLGFSLASLLFTTTTIVLSVALPGWVISMLPLFAPPIRRPSGRLLVSSETWVQVSVALSVVTGLAMAAFVLVRLLMTRPEIA